MPQSNTKKKTTAKKTTRKKTPAKKVTAKKDVADELIEAALGHGGALGGILGKQVTVQTVGGAESRGVVTDRNGLFVVLDEAKLFPFPNVLCIEIHEEDDTAEDEAVVNES